MRATLSDEFERHRAYLRSVAYRMLGSTTEADDAIQEAWLRLDRNPPDVGAGLRAWLTTVVGRICLDMLRRRRSRREDYVGSWLPEPISFSIPGETPEDEAVLADSVGLALLVVLETLTPAERLAFVLHDVFAVPFDEIAPVVGRSSTAARQLASRARRRVRATRTQPDADLPVQRRVVEAFLAAARTGDFDALLKTLDPDVVFRMDFGGRATRQRQPIVGAVKVLAEIKRGKTFAEAARPAIVNGAAGAIVGSPGGRTVAICSMTVVDGRIREIDIVGDRAKLRRLGLA